MVTVDALKLLYTKLGGTADVSSISAISDMVDLIEDVASSGGSGGGSLKVEVTRNEQGTSATVDKTYNEIKAALEAGQDVIFISGSNTDSITRFYLSELEHVEDDPGYEYLLALYMANDVPGEEMMFFNFYAENDDPDGSLIADLS